MCRIILWIEDAYGFHKKKYRDPINCYPSFHLILYLRRIYAVEDIGFMVTYDVKSVYVVKKQPRSQSILSSEFSANHKYWSWHAGTGTFIIMSRCGIVVMVIFPSFVTMSFAIVWARDGGVCGIHVIYSNRP